MRALRASPARKVGEIGGDEAIVKPFAAAWAIIAGDRSTPTSRSAQRAKSGAGEPGAAAEIEHRSKAQRPAGRAHRGFDRIAQQRRPAIGQALGQRRVVARGILVEQPAHIGFAHRRRRLAGAEPGELQPRAVIILRIGVAGLSNAATAPARSPSRSRMAPSANQAVANARRKLDGLRQNIGRAGKIAARGMIDRPFVAAVGDQIAGGNE